MFKQSKEDELEGLSLNVRGIKNYLYGYDDELAGHYVKGVEQRLQAIEKRAMPRVSVESFYALLDYLGLELEEIPEQPAKIVCKKKVVKK